VTAPAIAYGEPQDAFWDSAATFAGGAVVGGLLGWGLTEIFDDDDDDDDDWDDWDDWDSERVQDELRDRRDYVDERRDDVIAARDERREDRQGALEDRKEARQDRVADRTETREDRAAKAREQLNKPSAARAEKVGPAAGNIRKASAPAKVDRGRRDVKLPNAGTQAGVTDKVRQRGASAKTAQAPPKSGTAKLTSPARTAPAAKSAVAPQRSDRGMAGVTGNARQVRADADRGARSRQAAQPGRETLAQPAAFESDRVGGRGIAADYDRGGRAKFDSARGNSSRGGARGGGRGGGRGGR
jgi:hypothetical protein